MVCYTVLASGNPYPMPIPPHYPCPQSLLHNCLQLCPPRMHLPYYGARPEALLMVADQQCLACTPCRPLGSRRSLLSRVDLGRGWDHRPRQFSLLGLAHRTGPRCTLILSCAHVLVERLLLLSGCTHRPAPTFLQPAPVPLHRSWVS